MKKIRKNGKCLTKFDMAYDMSMHSSNYKFGYVLHFYEVLSYYEVARLYCECFGLQFPY